MSTAVSTESIGRMSTKTSAPRDADRHPRHHARRGEAQVLKAIALADRRMQPTRGKGKAAARG